MDTETFNEHIKQKEQDGWHFSTKFVNIMKEHNMNIKDLKVKIIEICNKNNLSDRKECWVEYYQNEILGLNQVLFIQKFHELLTLYENAITKEFKPLVSDY